LKGLQAGPFPETQIDVTPSPKRPSKMEAFRKFRPSSHFIWAHSWGNDPCGAVYLPETKEYVWCYQWHPGTVTPGNSAWGMARSKDMITWTDCMPALRNGIDTVYDSRGVFSGSITSRLVEGRRVLYLFYTSISYVPLHWSIPYHVGCETQSLAVSTDFGRTFQRYKNNPILTGPPEGQNTTGWRDPCTGYWPNMSRFRNVSAETNYMMISSGDKSEGAGPELILYESYDLLDWKFLCILLKVKMDTPIAGSELIWGRNFECASFLTVDGRDYITCGVEEHPSISKRHSTRYTVWLGGNLGINSNDGKPEFIISSFNLLDQGISYAPHITRGSKNEVLQLGWADEDENHMTEEQNWVGCLTLPRELMTVRHPVPANGLKNSHMWDIDTASNTMTTLGIRPAPQVEGLRKGSCFHNLKTLSSVRSKNYEIDAVFSSLNGHENLVFNVRQAPHDREVTRVIVSLASNGVTVDRSASSINNGNSSPDAGHFQLFPNEDLHVRIFVDNSILEVYVNERFALTSRIYPSLEMSLGVSCSFPEVSEESCNIKLWEGLINAWPEREGGTSGVDNVIGDTETNGLHLPRAVYA
jgi:beta-fructofuranosidase